jgi:pimeloyl-ACP methyl ester carboxylesterase
VPWGVLGVVAGLAVVDLLIHLVAVRYILPILERSPPFSVEATPPDPHAEPVSCRTPDGITLRGSLHRPPDRAPLGLIVFCPEVANDHWSATWYCPALLSAGFAILAMDFRNQGHSDRMPGYTPIHWLTEYEVTDVLAVVDYARDRADLRELPLGVFGVSRGGSAALVAAARVPEIACAACEGVFSISTMTLHYTLRWAVLYQPAWLMALFPTWHFRLTLALARWISERRRRCRYVLLEEWLPRLAGRPVLMIVDGRDTYVLPEISETLYRRFPQSSTRRWLVKAAKHNMARETDAAEFDRRIVEFFAQLIPRTPAASAPEASRLRPT